MNSRVECTGSATVGSLMNRRITFEQVRVGYSEIAKAVGRDGSSMPRERTRTAQKAALLRLVGIPEEQVGPVGARRSFSVSGRRRVT